MRREKKKRKRIAPLRHLLLVISVLVILLQRALRGNKALMRRLSSGFVRPVLRRLGERSAAVPYSVAELSMAVAALLLLVYILFCFERTRRHGGFFLRLYRFLITLLSLGAAVYAGFCVLWGVYYYGDDFMAQSGLRQEPVSTEQLSLVTGYFAALANTCADKVPRDADGLCATDRDSILDRSVQLYAALEEDYPCLAGPPLRAKPVRLSKVMSYVDFTGFFFPFTGEANVNTDCPPAFFAATVAHEQAHQRGVAKEQEANFVAVIACLRSADPEFVYSASLLAYSHLSNALYTADRNAWEQISSTLSEGVRADLQAERSYWQRFQTPVREVSNTVYESFLHSYDQTLGLRSYGACVDLLINYYYESVAALYGGEA